MKNIMYVATAIVIASALPLVPAQAADVSDIKALTALEERICAGIKSMDTEAIVANYVQDDKLYIYDMQIPRAYIGIDTYRKDWNDFWRENSKSIGNCTAEDFSVVDADKNLAISHFVQHVELMMKTGQSVVANTRITHSYRRVNGHWLVSHEHGSFPIDFKTGKADMLSKR
jgi:ketosteroid isomerase-like protein